MTRWSLLAVILLSAVGCDQTTKAIATRSLADAEPMSFLGDTLRIQYALNPGAFLSLGSQLPPAARFWLLTGAGLVMVAGGIGVLVVRWNLPRAQFLAIASITAGGIGNLIDRVTQDGHVTDFLNVGIGSLRTGIFNVADMVLMAGTAVLCWSLSTGQPFEADGHAGPQVTPGPQPQ
jgi:signal peptidase II